MVFDDTKATNAESKFTKQDWTEVYHDAKENSPPNALEVRGNTVQLNCFVDADHAGDCITRNSHTGILIFLNRAPIIWFAKQ